MPSEQIQVGAMSVRFLVEGAEPNGSVAIFELGVAAHAKLPAPHSHDAYEETIYGLAGTSAWTVEGVTTELGAGDALCIPRGAVHAFDNPRDVEARALCVVTPGILGPGYFRDIQAIFIDAHGGPPDLARFGEVMRRHGLTPARPPAT